MKLLAHLFLNVENMDEGYMLWNGTESYYKKLRVAYSDIQNGKESEYLNFAFFTLCAATLEYSLNFTLTSFCLSNFGMDKYKSYAEGYIAIPFAKKLLLTPTIVSNGKLRFKEGDSSYKNLLELISLRNKILHNKEFLKEYNFKDTDNPGTKEEMNLKLEIEPNHIDRLNKELCLGFGKSLGEFKKYVMDPSLEHTISENKMLCSI